MRTIYERNKSRRIRRKEFLLVFPCETEGVCIEGFLFSPFLNTAICKCKRNNMRGCIHTMGVRFCSCLRCQKESERDDEPGPFHVSLLSNPVPQDRLDAAAEWARLGSAP